MGARTRLGILLFILSGVGLSSSAGPVVLDRRLDLDLIAADPEIVTPTGIACDERGRLFVIESHTHFRSKDYSGPKHDRIRLLEDVDGDGVFEKIGNFAEGLRLALGLVVDGPQRLYVITRSALILIEDSDDDGRADRQSKLVRLETPGTFPHNGLSGIALGPLGELYFSLGENSGKSYKLIGSDGQVLASGGEGGNIYRCRADGSGLHLVARGFWNTFGLGFDRSGKLLAVDNDPDSRPPCRLLHIVEGGDYGFRYRNGRSGTHPLTAWDGELPGTLPMVGRTGEAPAGILAYESNGLPADYFGKWLVSSWGEHRIDAFTLRPRGASFGAEQKALVRGGDDFRPVGLCTGPDGSLYFTDWVLRDFQVHGRGRVWRLRAKDQTVLPDPHPDPVEKSAAAVKLERLNRALLDGGGTDQAELAMATLTNDAGDPFLFSAGVRLLSRSISESELILLMADERVSVRLAAMLAYRLKFPELPSHAVAALLKDSDPRIRRTAIQWVGESGQKNLGDLLEGILQMPVTEDIFRTYLATRERLAESPPKTYQPFHGGHPFALPVLLDRKADPQLRQLALRALPPAYPGLETTALVEILDHGDVTLQREVIWTLRDAPRDETLPALQGIIGDPQGDKELRADAVAALAVLAEQRAAAATLLQQLATQEGSLVQSQAQQLLQAKQNPPKPISRPDDVLRAIVGQPGNPEEGRRVFFNHRGPGCYRCHRVEGRGGTAAPDLTRIMRQLDGERLLESLVAPSKEIAPEFAAWHLTPNDGRTLTGLFTGARDPKTGKFIFVDQQGATHLFASGEIEEVSVSKKSLMPEKLLDPLTDQQIRDLIAFLRSLE